MSNAPAIPLSTPITPVFDPRAIPVAGTDAHLPAVPWARMQVTELRRRWANPPPWQPEVREEPSFSTRARRSAAVLVGLVPGPEGLSGQAELSVLLTERTAHLPTHAGQVAFPGGKVDPGDADVVAAALREAWEEVGLRADGVEVLGCLPEYLTGTGFAVTPVVALLPGHTQLTANPGEVAEVFQVPLPFLMNPAHHRRHVAHWQGVQREWFSMPYHEPRLEADGGAVERYIWGATAGMLRNLYRFLIA